MSFSEAELGQHAVRYEKVSETQLEELGYDVSLNIAKYYELLRDNNLTDAQIRENLVVLDFNPSINGLKGAYSLKTRRLRILTNPPWRKFLKNVDTALDIVENKKRPSGQSFKDLLVTERLSNYLQTAPAERSVPFAIKLISNAVSKDLSKTMIHEMKHQIDFYNDPDKYQLSRVIQFLGLFSSIPLFFWMKTTFDSIQPDNLLAPVVSTLTAGWGSLSYYLLLKIHFNPVELSAYSYADEKMDDPYWRDLVIFKPKV